MKKKLIGVSLVTAALAISASMTAFAAGWTQDTNGWSYQRDNGSWVGCGWFTDPADGAIYYIDPDGYMMTDTHIEGFRLGPDGRRVEKTAEEIQKEAEKKQRDATKASPSKDHSAADLAVDSAKATNIASSTKRIPYQAEMKTLMDVVFLDTLKNLKAMESPVTGSTTEDNLETTYRFSLNGNHSIVSSLWKASNKKSASYVPNALTLMYNRNAVSEESHVTLLDTTFRRLLVAALGENTGNALFDNILAENAKGNHQFEWTGNSDSSNYYSVTCNNGTITLELTCSEKTAEELAAEQAAAAAVQE